MYFVNKLRETIATNREMGGDGGEMNGCSFVFIGCLSIFDVIYSVYYFHSVGLFLFPSPRSHTISTTTSILVSAALILPVNVLAVPENLFIRRNRVRCSGIALVFTPFVLVFIFSLLLFSNRKNMFHEIWQVNMYAKPIPYRWQ